MRPEQLRALAVPVGVVAVVVGELGTALAGAVDTGSPELTAAVEGLVGAWRPALGAQSDAVRAIAQRLDAAAHTYEAVDALVAGWTGR